jgi:hypothetical protein
LAVCPTKPDLAPDRPAAGRTISTDPPNWYSECQFGASPEWPAGPSGLRPSPAGLTAELVGLYKIVGRPLKQFFLTSPPPHARPHLHGRRPLVACCVVNDQPVGNPKRKV